MPRRYWDYLPQFQRMHGVSTVGAFILGMGLLLIAIYLIVSLKKGKIVGPNPWNATTLDWQTTSPPHPHNFEHQPVVSGGPYEFEKVHA